MSRSYSTSPSTSTASSRSTRSAGSRACSGGTCVTGLEATVHLLDSPPWRTLVVAGYEDAPTAAEHVPTVMEHRPLGLEGVDELLIEDMTLLGKHVQELSLLPDGRGWL